MELAFYVAGAVALASTVMTITRMNAMHALLYLIVSLLAVAVVFFTLGAPFVAALEVIIYAGAIMVLFIFMVMLLNLGPRSVEQERALFQPGIWRGPSLLALLLAAELAYALSRGTVRAPAAAAVGPKEVGLALYGPYVIGVELASLLLMAALVGAYHLGWRRHLLPEEIHERSTDRARVVAGGAPVRPGHDGAAGAPERDLHVDVH